MIRVEDRVSLRLQADEAFATLTDFTRLPEWDPGIARVTRCDSGPLRLGSTFDVVARFAGRDVPMRYEVEAFDPALREATLVGRASGIRATDFIHVLPRGDHSEVHWRAEFQLLGARRLLAPLMRPLFHRLAAKAMNGLRAHLGESPRNL